jgi:hypothetical protein
LASNKDLSSGGEMHSSPTVRMRSKSACNSFVHSRSGSFSFLDDLDAEDCCLSFYENDRKVVSNKTRMNFVVEEKRTISLPFTSNQTIKKWYLNC